MIHRWFMRLKTFNQLLLRILDRSSVEDACRAWDELHRMPSDKRQRLLMRSFQKSRNEDEPVVRYLLRLGAWSPPETLAVLSSFAEQDNALAWYLLAAQLPARQMFVDGQPLHPFSSFDGSLIELRPAVTESIQAFFSKQLSSRSLTRISLVLDALAMFPSAEGFSLLVDFICDPEGDADCRLVATPYMKTVAESVVKRADRQELEREISRLATVVGNDEEETNLRMEIAFGYPILPSGELRLAIRRLLDHIRRTRTGSYYLPELEEMLTATQPWQPLQGAAAPCKPEELSDFLLKMTGNPSLPTDPDLPALLAQGLTIQFDSGRTATLDYSREVVDHCLSLIPSLERYDPAWCLRYAGLLASIISRHGSAEGRLRCLSEQARLGLVYRQFDLVVDALEKAAQKTEGAESTPDCTAALGACRETPRGGGR